MTKRSPGLFDPTALDELQRVLDPEHAKGVLDHRKAKRAPLTAFAAKLLAKKFEATADPNAAAEKMITMGWAGFEPEWVTDRQHVQKTHELPPRGVEALRADLQRRIMDDEQPRAAGPRSADPETDRGLSLLGWQGNARPH